MKKAVLFLLGLSPLLALAQSQQKLSAEFAAQNRANQQKYDQLLLSTGKNVKPDAVSQEKATLAGFAGKIPVFLESSDRRANNSANVTALQNGTLPGLNGVKLEGNGINILVMDGGRIFEKHVEFGAVNGVPAVQRVEDKENGAAYYSSHATNVAGIIGAEGIGNFGPPYGAKGVIGVLPKSTFDSYTFYTTPSGNNYVKLNDASTANISNHSYGINLGWTYVSTPNSIYPTAGYYWLANYELNNLDTYSGSYFDQDAAFDKIVYNNPNHIVVKSAGNYYGIGPKPGDKAYKFDETLEKYVLFEPGDVLPAKNCSKGYYCIGWGSLAKNIIVVGATEQLGTNNNEYTEPGDVLKASYSSAGPRRDGAIKPDISAVGSMHAVANFTSTILFNEYAINSGTSFSAPVVTGIAGAVTELTRNLKGEADFIYKADEMKALLTHTANDVGNEGPDVWYGWGFVDAGKAATAVIEKEAGKTLFERKNLTSGSAQLVEVFAEGGKPLKASISWVDPAAEPFETDEQLQNDLSSRLVNDLDLRIIDTTTNETYFPWRLNPNAPMELATKGDNTVDNVEQVLLDNPVAGRKYRIEVSNKGTLKDQDDNATTQNYALLVTGIVPESTLASVEVSKETVTVYPTVVQSEVNVLIPGRAESIEMYDMAGKRVLNIRAKAYQTVDVSRLPAGMYIIKVVADGQTVTKKIIKK